MTNINTENIQVGQLFPNIKALLVAVGLQRADETLAGNTLYAQIKVLKLYVEFENVPNSRRVIVTKILK